MTTKESTTFTISKRWRGQPITVSFSGVRGDKELAIAGLSIHYKDDGYSSDLKEMVLNGKEFPGRGNERFTDFLNPYLQTYLSAKQINQVSNWIEEQL
jgi:hypothetical protein